MPRRFQFSLGRLLACISALCLAAAAWLMVGAGIGFLAH